MRSLRLILLGCLLPAAVHAQKPLREARPADPAGAVRINNIAGTVHVIGWDRDSIVVEGTVPERGEPFVFHVSGANAKLGVWGDDQAASGAAQLRVYVPARSRVWLKTTTADVQVEQVRGGVDVSSVSGRIEVSGSPGEANLESMGGAVLAEVDTRVLRARTAGGDITIRGRVADAQVYTVSGLVSVNNKQVERGRFESVDGGVNYRGGVARASTVEFVTHSGTIDVALPAAIDADVRISSYQGEVHNLLGGKLEASGGKLKSREYALSLGRGGAELIIRTFKGTVRLRKL